MKKIFLSFIAVLAFTTAWSQTDLKINPIGFLFGSPDVSAEFGISESMGVEPFVGVTYSNFKIGEATLKSNGFRLGGVGKYYFSPEKGLDKFWAGVYLRGGTSTSTGTVNGKAEETSNARVALGLGLGYKWVSSKNIVFELGFGAGRALLNKYTVKSGSADLSQYPILNIDLLTRIQVGYRFGGGGGGKKK